MKFVLEEQEFNLLISQSVISKPIGRGGTRKPPMVFTEQGVAMLSSILKSDCAIDVNIAIMRAFVQMRKLMTTHKKLIEKIKKLLLTTDPYPDDLSEYVVPSLSR